MPVFALRQPVQTPEPVVRVEAGLRPGVYTFQLVVVNDRGRSSAPDRVRVVIRG